MDSRKVRETGEPGGRANIILVGMMGTGKSTSGALAAQELGYTLIDLDQVIVEMEGRSIPDIFAAAGEAGFREAETRALEEVVSGNRQVIATGGGAVLRPGNVKLMKENGLVIALTASAEEIIARVSGDSGRPLLAGNTEERVRALLEERRDAYAFAHCSVDTTGKSAAEVSAHILMHYRG